MSVSYAWRPGSRVRIDPNKAGREMTRIEREAGALTPETVLERARSANSALHDHFEWDDSIAAEQHRLSQAGELIRSITVNVSRSNVEDPKHVRAFLNVARDEERSYVSSSVAMSDADLRKQVLERAWRDLEAWRKRYAELTELSRIFAVIDQARPAE